ncbi:MAG: hypothetical protein ACRDNZ_16390 [Streptosporangiaceae bacterium]
MISASWASVLAAVAVLAGALSARLWAAGRREGRIDAVLEKLTELTADLDERVRLLEHRPGRRR